MHLKTHIYGYPGDPAALLHRLWWYRFATINNLPLDKIPLLPITPEISLAADSPLVLFWQRFLVVSLGEVLAHNLILLASFVISGLTAAALTIYLTKNKVASFAAGFFYSFSLYHLWQGLSHLTLAEIQWLPLLLLSLFYLRDKRNLKAAIFSALAFSLTFLSQYYYGFLGMLFAFGFFLIDLSATIITASKAERLKETKKTLLSYILFGVSAMIFISPFSFGIIKSCLHPPKGGPITFKHGAEETLAYAARPWDYLIPSPLHPIFGKHVKPIYTWIEKAGGDYEFKSAGYPEQVVYLGFVPLSLAIYGTYKSIKEKTNRRLVFTLVTLAFWMFLVSLPAQWSLGKFIVNLPAFYLYKIAPMFRVYARAGVFVGLCVYALAGIGIKSLVSAQTKRRGVQLNAPTRESVLIPIALLTLYILETFNGKPNLMNVKRIPEVYQWLTKQKGDTIIAEYPQDNSGNDLSGGCPDWLDPKITRDYSQTLSRLYQRIHQNKVVEIQALSPEERVSAGDLSTKKAYNVLKKYDIDYVIWHTKDPFPQPNPIDTCQSRRFAPAPKDVYPKLKLVKRFDEGVIYKVT